MPLFGDRSLKLVLAIVLFCLGATAACSNDKDDPDARPPDSRKRKTTSMDSATTTSPAEAEAGVIEAWRTLWLGMTLTPGTKAAPTPEAQAAARAVAEPKVIETFPEQATLREATVDPVPKLQADGSYVVEDCVFLQPAFTANAMVAMTGRVVNRDDSWVITELGFKNGDPCVSKSMAKGAIEGYEAYWDGLLEFWNPPDPNHPLVAETTTGPRRQKLEADLADQKARGLHYRGRPITHPEVTEVRSLTEIVISDCQEGDPEMGIYDASGKRLDDLIKPVEPGQRAIREAVLRLEDGKWKVEDLQGQTNVECEFAPTEEGVAVAE